MSQMRYLVLPVLILCSLIFGGTTSQAPNVTSFIIPVAFVLFAYSMLTWNERISDKNLSLFLLMFALVFILAVVQLMPLPRDWFHGAFRAKEYEGWELLGIAAENVSISLAPQRTYLAFSFFLIPIATVLFIYRIGWSAASKYFAVAIIFSSVLSSLLGVAQVIIGGESFYLYEQTNKNYSVGFFANANHHSTFINMSISFTIYLLGVRVSRSWSDDYFMARKIILFTVLALQIFSVLIAGSLAGYGLLAVVLVTSYLLLIPAAHQIKMPIIIAGIASALSLLILVFTSPNLNGLGVTSFDNNNYSRIGMFEKTTEAISDYYLTGTGLGTFEYIYRLYEKDNEVEELYVLYAHNDYLQWTLETGLLGLLVLIVCIACVIKMIAGILALENSKVRSLKVAASISFMVPVVHTFVDYPIRMPSILFLMSICISIVAIGRRQSRKEKYRYSGKTNVTCITV